MKMRISFLLIVFFCFQLSAQAITDTTDERYSERSYRRFLLPNQLQVLLISDPTTHQAAASLSVAVGSLNNPWERLGMAHFLEHMLFLGTEKYPAVDAYKKFISSHDGYSNAYTAADHTNYHFQIASDHLEGGLDRFSQFFVAPLFDPKYVGREMNAVDSEYSKNVPNDFWRISMVERLHYAPGHPGRQFRIGNLETLSSTSREELLEFYKTHYSSNLMALVILGKQDLDTLQKWTTTYFAGISNRNLPEFQFPPTYLPKSDQLRLLKVKPVKDNRTLKLSFALPEIRHHYRSKPAQILGFLVGHEGPGSLLSLLKKENLATGLSAGGFSNNSFGTFSVSIELTAHGLDNYQTVITRVFQYLRLLRQSGISEEVYDEIRRMAEINHRFQEKQEGTGLVTRLAALLHYIPLTVVETAPYLFTEYDPKRIDSVLYRLMPDNMLITLVSRDVDVDQKEHFYGTEYSYSESNPEFIQALQKVTPHPELHLPEKNIFIPQDLNLVRRNTPFGLTYQSIAGLRQEALPASVLKTLETQQGNTWNSWDGFVKTVFANDKPQAETYRQVILKHALVQPEKIVDNERGEIWFQQDLRFDTPKAHLTYLINTPEVYRSPRSAVLSQLYVSAINEGLNEFGYGVRLAGLDYSISTGKKGITLGVSGYSDRILELLTIISGKLKEIAIDEATFASLKEKQIREYQNFQFNQPYQQAFYFRRLLLEAQKFSLDQYKQVVSSITLNDVRDYAKTLYRKTYVQGVVHGNLDREKTYQGTLQMLEVLGSTPLPKDELFVEKILQLNPKANYVYSQKASVDNSAVVFGVQVGPTNPDLRGALLVISRALSPRFYTELRTNQQLGYIVHAGMNQMEKTLGWIFLVQSGEYPAGELQQRIESYILRFIDEFQNLSDAEFDTLRNAVINAKLERSSTIAEQASRLFYVAFEKDAEFDHVSEDIEAVEALSKAKTIEIAKRYLSAGKKRSLVVQMVGKSHQDMAVPGSRIDSVEGFKSKHSVN